MKKNAVKILHITPHLGTGVGTVVLNYLSKVAKNHHFEHKVICLDYANKNSIKISKKIGFSLLDNMSKKIPRVLSMIAESDIVLVHWWNHPLLYDFLVREKIPASRIIFWSHVLGSAVPNNFTDKLLKYPDIFVFTTPISFKTKEVKKLPIKFKRNLKTIWSTGGSERLRLVRSKKHSGFNVGYIGTVDYTKMHSDFLKMSSAADMPGVKFIIVGGPNNKALQEEAIKLGLADKFIFTGFVTEDKKWELLSIFDVFGYPLAPHHYGSSDQALQEAMAAGVVPIVFSNPMESYMVKNNKTGIIAKNQKLYTKALEKLYRNYKFRIRLSKEAKKYAKREFSLKKMENDWNKIFKDILKLPKTEKKWEIDKANRDIMPKDVFLESLGGCGQPFASYCKTSGNKNKNGAEVRIKKLAESANWRSKSKGTVHQYNSFLPNDPYLCKWSQLMEK